MALCKFQKFGSDHNLPLCATMLAIGIIIKKHASLRSIYKKELKNLVKSTIKLITACSARNISETKKVRISGCFIFLFNK